MIDWGKVAIVGSGYVGASVAYTLTMSKLYTDIVLIDTDVERARGEAMDISHAVPFIGATNVYEGNYADVADAGIIVVTAGYNQKEGESRLDLVTQNVSIMRNIIAQIALRPFEGIILIVTNPVDIMTYVAKSVMMETNPSFPRNHIFGSGTVLDTARLRYMLGERLNIDSRNIHALIIGEHGDNEMVLWSSANIGGIPLSNFCARNGIEDIEPDENDLAYLVKRSAYEIIRRKKATNFGIAMAVSRICEAVVNDERSLMPLSRMMLGEYGIYNVVMSVPSIVGKSGVEADLSYTLTPKEEQSLRRTADILKEVLEEI